MKIQEKAPLVSVVMPAYNVEKYVEEAVRSILAQTFCDFEFIIVDDGSTDRTPDILRSFSDPRIRLLFNEKNEGNYPARNRGCRLARGKYIAVMDADDVAMPERLEKQVKYMEEHPDVLACGTAYRLMDENRVIVEATQWEDIRYILMKTFCILHPSLLFRKKTMELVGYYRTESRYAEDYDLVLRLARQGKVINIADVLLNRRRHDEQISKKYNRPQNDFSGKVQLRYQHECGIFYPPKDHKLFLKHIAAYLRATVSYVHQGGLYNGRLGIILFFYLYSEYEQEQEYRNVADSMLINILSNLKSDIPVNLNYGVCGLGFLLCFLSLKGFVESDSDDIMLKDIDRMILEKTDFNLEDRSLGTGLLGVLYYVSYRLNSQTIWVNTVFNTGYQQRWLKWIHAWKIHSDWAISHEAILSQCENVLLGDKITMDWDNFWRILIQSLPREHALEQCGHGLFQGIAGWGVNKILNLDICRENTYIK